jgi:hypothetical protein
MSSLASSGASADKNASAKRKSSEPIAIKQKVEKEPSPPMVSKLRLFTPPSKGLSSSFSPRRRVEDPQYPPSPDSAAVFSLEQKVGNTRYTVRNSKATSGQFVNNLEEIWHTKCKHGSVSSLDLPSPNGLEVFYLGLLLWSENKRDEALEKFKEAAKMEPGSKLMNFLYPWLNKENERSKCDSPRGKLSPRGGGVSPTAEEVSEMEDSAPEVDEIPIAKKPLNFSTALGEHIPIQQCLDNGISETLVELSRKRMVFEIDKNMEEELHDYTSFIGMFVGSDLVDFTEEISSLLRKRPRGPYRKAKTLFSQVHLTGNMAPIQKILQKVVDRGDGKSLPCSYFARDGELENVLLPPPSENVRFYDVVLSLFGLESIPPESREPILQRFSEESSDLLLVVFDSPAVLFDDSLGPERVSHLVQTFERGLQKKNLSQSTLDRAKDVLYLFYDLTMSTRSKIRQFRKNNLMEWCEELESNGFAINFQRKLVDHWWAPIYLISASSRKYRARDSPNYNLPLTPRAKFHSRQRQNSKT